jgi:peptide/nickel transport system substrate-binding protein
VRPKLLLAALAVIAASVVSDSGASARPVKEGGTFRMAITTGLFGAIDPALWGFEGRILRPACSALMSFPDKPLPAGLQLKPELAEAYPKVSADRKTYTFTLRKNVRFSDGSPVTARVFVHALERLFDPKMRINFRSFEAIVGAREMLAGKATTLSGAVATGRVLRLRLTQAVPDLLARTSLLCAVPANLPADPEGAKAPLHSPAPYYVSEYVPGERVVLERNRFYRGERPHHVDRITVDLQADVSAVDEVASGKLDSLAGTPNLNPQLSKLVRRYGVNSSRVFIEPDIGVRLFFLNTSRPLFRNNLELRRAVNFAADRRALVREYGPYAATPTDQYLPASIPGFRDGRVYPLQRPDLRRARSLAKGRRGSGKAVLYTCSEREDCIAVAQILQQNLKAIGLRVTIKQFPLQIMFQKLGTPGEPYDIAWVGFLSGWNDPQDLLGTFDGRTIGQPDNQNWSYFNTPKYNRLFARAARLTGPRRYRAYGDLDVQLARDGAPAIAAMNPNTWAFVSARTGCVVMNPSLDLTAVCLT